MLSAIELYFPHDPQVWRLQPNEPGILNDQNTKGNHQNQPVIVVTGLVHVTPEALSPKHDHDGQAAHQIRLQDEVHHVADETAPQEELLLGGIIVDAEYAQVPTQAVVSTQLPRIEVVHGE